MQLQLHRPRPKVAAGAGLTSARHVGGRHRSLRWPEVLTLHVRPVPAVDAEEVLIALDTAGVGTGSARQTSNPAPMVVERRGKSAQIRSGLASSS